MVAIRHHKKTILVCFCLLSMIVLYVSLVWSGREICLGSNLKPYLVIMRRANEDSSVSYRSLLTGKELDHFSSPGDIFWTQTQRNRSAALHKQYASYCLLN